MLRLRWYSWLPVDLYESAIGAVMALFAAAAAGFGIANLLGLVSDKAIHLSHWYEKAFGLLASAALFWVGLKSSWTSLVDLVCPASSYQGRLDGLSGNIGEESSAGFMCGRSPPETKHGPSRASVSPILLSRK